MKRKMFNFAALVSLLLCVATVVMWVRSYRLQDGVHITDARNWDIYALSPRGGVIIGYRYGGPLIKFDVRQLGIGPQGGWSYRALPSRYSYRNWPAPGGRHSSNWRLGGFALLRGKFQRMVERSITLPYWFLSLLTSITPLFWMFRIYRPRKLVGCCRNCFYSLTGNVSGVCPECGVAVAGKVGA